MISGHNNPANAWYYYQEHGYKYNPDLVMLGVTLGNDITWHNYRAGVLPMKNAQGGAYLSLRPNLKQDGAHLAELLLPKDAYAHAPLFLKKIRKLEFRIRWRLAEMSYIFGYCVPPALGPLLSLPYRVYAADSANSLGLFYQPVMPEIEKMFCDFEEVLSGFNLKVTINGSKFLMVLFPVKIQVAQGDYALLRRLYFLKKEKFDLYYPNLHINNFCKNNHIEMLDLSNGLTRYKNKKLYRSRGDMHLNESGQELSARIIAGRVAAIIN